MTHREFVDSREGFSSDDLEAYVAEPSQADLDAAEVPSEEDYAEMDAMFKAMDLDDDYEDDGQPDEYTEWQDLYGGDDWDHGQYDEY